MEDIFYGYTEEKEIRERLDNIIQSKRIYKMKVFREETGLTQKEFAEYFGIPIRTVQEWEQGRRKPTEYMLPLMKRVWQVENKVSWNKIRKED